jgi:glucokinase
MNLYYVGVDIGGTKIAAGIVDSSGNLMYKDSIRTDRTLESDIVISNLAAFVKKVIADAGFESKNILGVGIGIPAAANSKTHTIYNCNYVNLGNNLIEEFRKHIDLPVFVENDGNATAYAEYVDGEAKGLNPSLTITLGTGIGGGVIIDGQIFSGFNGSAMEIGHMVIVRGGLKCVCGRSGCWEKYASASALIAQSIDAVKAHPESIMMEMIDSDIKKIDTKIAFSAAERNDVTAIELVHNYIGYVAEGLENLISIFQPEIVTIGGGISNEGENLIAPLRDRINRDVFEIRNIPKCIICKTRFANDTGIIGAALLCKTQNFKRNG